MYNLRNFAVEMKSKSHILILLLVSMMGGKSFSHTMQVDATYPFFQGFSVTAAYRLNGVRINFGKL